MNILVPFSTHESPSRRARMRIDATSEPASGSVTATAVTSSPAITFRRYRSSCAFEPARTRCGEAMSVWSSTVMTKPPNVERASDSWNTTAVTLSAPAPPYSGG